MKHKGGDGVDHSCNPKLPTYTSNKKSLSSSIISQARNHF